MIINHPILWGEVEHGVQEEMEHLQEDDGGREEHQAIRQSKTHSHHTERERERESVRMMRLEARGIYRWPGIWSPTGEGTDTAFELVGEGEMEICLQCFIRLPPPSIQLKRGNCLIRNYTETSWRNRMFFFLFWDHQPILNIFQINFLIKTKFYLLLKYDNCLFIFFFLLLSIR